MKQLSLRVSDELYEAIEQARGQIPRERWLRLAAEEKLQSDVRAVEGHPAEYRTPG